MNAISLSFTPWQSKSKQKNRCFEKSRALRVLSEHSSIEVKRVSYQPPGTEHSLINEVSFSLPEKSFGLIFGQSGSGKTTLLQLLAGFSKPTSGSICIQRYGNDGNPNSSPKTLLPENVGIVFQFPERFFLADTVIEEITFGWPRQKADFAMREQLALKLQYAINSGAFRFGRCILEDGNGWKTQGRTTTDIILKNLYFPSVNTCKKCSRMKKLVQNDDSLQSEKFFGMVLYGRLHEKIM